jgi:hypothetical protein
MVNLIGLSGTRGLNGMCGHWTGMRLISLVVLNKNLGCNGICGKNSLVGFSIIEIRNILLNDIVASSASATSSLLEFFVYLHSISQQFIITS